MKSNKSAKKLLLMVCLCSSAIIMSTAFRVEAKSPKNILEKLLSAVEDYDYNSFVANGDANFKAGITMEELQGISMQLSSRLSRGYNIKYLGKIKKQQGYLVYLWKLVYKDEIDEALVTLTIKEGKVAGFVLQ